MKTTAKGRTVLVGEDELEVRGYLEMSLKCLGYSVEFAEDGEEVLRRLRDRGTVVDAVLLDILMPNRDGFETLTEIRRTDPALPVIVVSGCGNEPANIIHAMKRGATDFLCKPVSHEELRDAIDRAIESRQVVQRAVTPLIPAKPTGFVGTSPNMLELQTVASNVGWCETPVLIQGETGSGKEVLARELHAQSPRANKLFLKLNCAALPSELVESELFGYEKGAFTGAFQKKLGMFEMADGGTILLDEIGDMDVRLQAKLLQVLQDQEFQRIGGKDTIQVDVRVIAATHRDLEKAIAENTFREDLYYRLNVITLHLPPLRERQEDILPLAEFLWKKHSGVGPLPMTPSLRHVFLTYQWPGNVRELENTVRRLIVLRDPGMVARDLIARSARKQPDELRVHGAPPLTATFAMALPPAPKVLEEVSKAQQQAEIEAILAALNATRWNRKQAAALLKVDYKALLYKMKKLGMEHKVVAFGPNQATPVAKAATGTA
jgi:two-component system response regulator AtoC